MTTQKDYRKTLRACYLGYVAQAICANFVPLLFLTFAADYGIPLERIALIPTVFFLTQLLVDLAAARFVDRLGYRPAMVLAHGTAAAGLALLTVLPDRLPDAFGGILAAVMVYAVGSSLIEVLVSPIVEACPLDNKAGRMSLLHSFYCWGGAAVVLGSTLFFAWFGVEHWRVLTLLWALVPFGNLFAFLRCPLARLVEEDQSLGIGRLLRLPVFWLLVLLMACAGAAESSMAQWASAFTESALGVSKTTGDLAGPCLFALLMGLARLRYARPDPRRDLAANMLGSGALCLVCYLVAALSPVPAVGLAGCALCGWAVGILWPGTLSLAARTCPTGGTALFAFLALAGDLGGTAGPLTVGLFSGAARGDLRRGLLAAALFSLVLVAGLSALRRTRSH